MPITVHCNGNQPENANRFYSKMVLLKVSKREGHF